MKLLDQALSLAEPQGYIRTFVNEGIPVENMLKKIRKAYPAQQPGNDNQGWTFSLNYIETLLTAFDDNQGISVNEIGIVPANQHERPMLESLSEREHEVLRLIAAGQSNREIAQSLIVGMNTVKTHVKSIYAKLDVHSRTQALVRAQSLRLL